MRAVSNTSPISNLAIIDRLDLLRARYGLILIPQAVQIELANLSHISALQKIQSAIANGWIVVKPDPSPLSLPFPLDPGESSAIALALYEKADVLLIDEKRGREAARSVPLNVAGILGELLHAKLSGSLTSVKIEMDRLRNDAHFFIDPAIEQFILSQVGEK